MNVFFIENEGHIKARNNIKGLHRQSPPTSRKPKMGEECAITTEIANESLSAPIIGQNINCSHPLRGFCHGIANLLRAGHSSSSFIHSGLNFYLFKVNLTILTIFL